jgi:cytochrome c peroxidase
MKGPTLTWSQLDAADAWLRALPAPPAAKAADASAAERGQALFEGAANCATCHSGAMRTNNQSRDVQTGGVFQVPSLIGVSWRAPYLHDGSAPSIAALLGTGHGGATLDASQIEDITAYVETF